MKKIIIFLIIVLTFLGIVQIFLSGNISAQVGEVDLLEKQTENFKKENLKLEREIAFYSSLVRIEKEAEKLGFKSGYFLIDYSLIEPVALRRE